MCNFVQLVDNKTIRVHEFPTLKFNIKFRELVQVLAKNLTIQNVFLSLFQRKVQVFEKK